MARRKPRPAEPIYFDPKEQSGGAKLVGGSNHDDFNQTLVDQVVKTVALAGIAPEYQDQLKRAAVAAIAGIEPRDELEGILAANIVATHFVRMECLRRGMRENRSAEQVKDAVNNATKLGRDLTGMVGALDKHRGRGQQRITVKHVHVNNGGQAIVGAITGRGVVPAIGQREADPAMAISYQPEQPMPLGGS